MPTIPCPHCGKSVAEPDPTEAGNWFRCPHCQQKWQYLGHNPTITTASVGNARVSDTAFKTGLGIGVGIYAIGAVCSLLVSILGWMWWTHAYQKEVDTTLKQIQTFDFDAAMKEHQVRLQVLEHHLDYVKSGDGYARYIVGTAKNSTRMKCEVVQVAISLYDAQGNVIGSTEDTGGPLYPGETWKFNAPVTEDNMAKYAIKEAAGTRL